MSRRRQEEGTVMLEVYIQPNGKVGEVRLKQTSGFPRLDAAALEAVKRWGFIPARRGNDPIPYWYTQPILFSLKS